jgi:phosphoribosyl-ATP pyrophosphohydrolase/phosphoribosyl-AMP cyclohydrolase/histidinol dehydrogenase
MEWTRLDPADVLHLDREPVDAATLAQTEEIVETVRAEGERALRSYAERFGDRTPGDPLVVERGELEEARDGLTSDVRELLERTASRIEAFAEAQQACFTDLHAAIPGGRAGHHIRPVDRAGCYAPGGRFPLPSSVLMTAVTARVAGVSEVWVASPKPDDVTLAAAAIAGADAVLAVGGAHAIAALARMRGQYMWNPRRAPLRSSMGRMKTIGLIAIHAEAAVDRALWEKDGPR